ncbi:Uncharacterised protein [Yersinia enterocolitica]|uniref:Universal stress protein B n=1 Tax=Yersinia enterocolitica TaxID=630 RepID=A0A0T7P9F5_YEREN|nr:hypothetical protein [Yersinia enterocolitica]CFQ72220.1 Uncharacterised protein [Yersinia enterocolitica]
MIIDIIAIILIVLVLCTRRGAQVDLQRRCFVLSRLGYESVDLMCTDEHFMRAFRHVKFWSMVLRVLVVGYAASWIVTLLS